MTEIQVLRPDAIITLALLVDVLFYDRDTGIETLIIQTSFLINIILFYSMTEIQVLRLTDYCEI